MSVKEELETSAVALRAACHDKTSMKISDLYSSTRSLADVAMMMTTVCEHLQTQIKYEKDHNVLGLDDDSEIREVDVLLSKVDEILVGSRVMAEGLRQSYSNSSDMLSHVYYVDR